MSGKAHPVRVFVGRNITEAELCASYLAARGVHAEVQNPMTHMAFSGVDRVFDQEDGFGVVVSSDDAARAAAAVEEFETNRPLPDEDGNEDAELGGEGGEEE